MGGDCLNTGCVPSKALIATAKLLAHDPALARTMGIRRASAEFDFAEVMERVQRVVRTVEPHDSVERYTALGVECLKGTAKITSPWTVEVRPLPERTHAHHREHRDRRRRAPVVPPIPGLERVELLHLRQRVGPAQAAARASWCWAAGRSAASSRRLRAPGLEGHAGRDAAAHHRRARIRSSPRWSRARFREEGIDVLTRPQGEGFVVESGEKVLVVEHDGGEKRIACDATPLRRGPRGQHRGLRARGARHPGHQAEDRGDERVPADASIPTSTRAATWRARTSSRTPRRTWRGTAR